MKHLLSLLATAAAALSVAAGLARTADAVTGRSAAPQSGRLTVDYIRLAAPTGWTADGEGATAILSPPGTGADAGRIVVVAGPRSAQPLDLTAGFPAVVEAVLQGRKIVQSTRRTKGRTSDGSPFVAQNLAADDAKGNRIFASITVADVGNRLTVFGLLTASQASFGKYYSAYVAMLRRATFVVSENDLPDRSSSRPTSPVADGNPASNPAAIFPNPAKVKASEQARRRPGIVSGIVYGADGKPWHMPGARVTVSVWGITGSEDLIGVGGPPGGERTSYDITVDRRGHYELRIAGGGYRIKAQALIPHRGTLVPVDLDPLDGEPSSDYDQNSFRGIVRDFGLKLTGPRAGGAAANGYNGFTVGVSDASDIMARSWTRYPAGTHLHILLEPLTPLLDGSKGWPIDIDLDVRWMGEHCDRDGCAWSGVPFATYRATARYVLPSGDVVPARLDVDTAGTRLAESAVLDFDVVQDRFVGPTVVTPTIFVNDEQ